MKDWQHAWKQINTSLLHLKIRQRLLLSYAVVVIVPLLLLTMCVHIVLTDSLAQKSLQRMDKETETIGKNIEMFISEVQSFGKLMSVNPSLIWILSHPADRISTERYIAEREVRQEGGYYSAVINRSVRYEVYDMNANRLLKREEESFSADAIAEIIREKQSEFNNWFVAPKSPDTPTELYVCLLRRVIDGNTGYTIGKLLTYTKESSLRSAYAYDEYTNGEVVLVLDENDHIISCSDPDLLTHQMTEKPDKNSRLNFNGTRYYCAQEALEFAGWRVMSLVPYSYIYSDITRLVIPMLLVALCCLFLALGIAIAFSSSISKPVLKLVRMTDAVTEGNFTKRVRFVGGDEIALLGERFNEMVGRVDLLIKNIYAQQQMRKDLEIRLLQSQIKPHFLYNSLSTIISCVRLKDDESAIAVAKELAQFYRGSLSGGSDIVSLEQEVHITASYLYIQMIRYNDCLKYSIDIPKELLSYQIPKLTLQPLVENAIYHGIRESSKMGEIRVFGRLEEGVCHISVQDSGCGMDERQLMRLRADINNADRESGFGLSSIHARLTLMYGDAYGLTVESELGAGTCATVTFPAIRRMEKNDE
ncbi:MAG: hypothetical protein C0413_02135 [Clostridiales bacterium]|nr:hypothetical protein [Clostridiales bacterium]